MVSNGFIARRLTQAREIRGLSQTSLSMLAEITKTSISNYESGSQRPRPDAVSRLAQALNVPESLFFKEMGEMEQSPIYFRSLTSLTKNSRLQATRMVEWLSEIIIFLSEYVEFQDVTIPEFSLGNTPRFIPLQEIDSIAYECRKAMGLGFGPIPNMSRLLESMGCIIVRYDLNIHEEDGFSRWLHDGRTPISILSTDKYSACRDRFSQAHELGHLVMHRSIFPDSLNLKLLEEQANRFASSFLMPEQGYTRDFTMPSLDTFKALKPKWGSSIASQIMHCYNLGIIGKDEKRRLFILRSRRGWNVREPLDDTMPIEEANYLKNSLILLINEGLFSKDELLSLLGLPTADIVRLIGLPDGYFEIEHEPIMPGLKKVFKFPDRK